MINSRHRRRGLTIALVLLLAITPAFGGCRTSSRESEDSAPAPQPVLSVTAVRAEMRPMQQTLTLLGVTVAMRHVIVRAPSAGRVTSIHLKNGDVVRRGQVVARVVNREIEAAENGLAVAKKIDPQDAQTLSQSVARYSHDKGIPVLAPEDGVVSQPPVTDGQFVADLDTLADLIDPSSVYVEANVPLEELHLLHPGMEASVTSPLGPGAVYPARLGAVLPSFNSVNATSPVRIDFTGAERIPQAGAPAQAMVITSQVPDATVIPPAALFQEGETNGYHVFIAGPDGRAHRVPVTLGIRDEKFAQVLSGLKPGDLVITSGGYALSDGLRIDIAQGGA